MMQTKKSKKVVEEDPEVVAERERLAAFEKELKEYGRTWIWETYYNDSPEIME